MNERINRHDLDFADELYAPDLEWWLRLRATHHGEYAGLAPTGNRVDFSGCSLFEFAGDRVVRLAVYIDAATLMRQVAATP